MKQKQRTKTLLIAASVTLATAAIVIPLLVFAGSEQTTFTATAYSDVIRFEAYGVGSLQVRIYDMAENELWDSGQVWMDFVDWDRTNEWGERLANGYYIYFVQGWSNADELVLAKTGKVVLLPGDRVQLQSAPAASVPDNSAGFSFTDNESSFGPMAVDQDHSTESWSFGQVGIGTTSPGRTLDVTFSNTGADNGIDIENTAQGYVSVRYIAGTSQMYIGQAANTVNWMGTDSGSGFIQSTGNLALAAPLNTPRVLIDSATGNVGIGTTSPGRKLDVTFSNTGADNGIDIENTAQGYVSVRYIAGTSQMYIGQAANTVNWMGTDSGSGFIQSTGNLALAAPLNTPRVLIDSATGNVGIGTTSPTARLEIESSTGQDLIAAYNSSNRVFVVTSTGEVRADGTVYAADFQTGSADVAERINVSEWVEAGCVVEIDPDHPGFFRKTFGLYSRRVAGIISTSPGVILGNNIDPETDSWDDNRPVLAIAGRVPCKVSTENGPIQIGDLLVSSSTPGIAMKGDPEEAMGAVVGKAMEPLENGEGTIMVQVMLR